MSEHVKNSSDASFEQDVLQASQLVLVDFWAPWCGPCKMIGPIVNEVADAYAGRVQVCKHNVDDGPETPAKYGVRGIPTLLLFKDGEVVETHVGALSKTQLTDLLDKHL